MYPGGPPCYTGVIIATHPCRTCGVEKPDGDYPPRMLGKQSRSCRACLYAGQKRSALKNPETRKAYHRAYSRSTRYGITPERYAAMLDAQGGRCAICQEVPDVLCVDHDHACCAEGKSCGKCVRGLLCRPCNSALGRFKDDPEILIRAIKYLQGE